MTPDVRAGATRLRALLAAYRDKKDLIAIGAYERGSDPVTDMAIDLKDSIDGFLKQRPDEAVPGPDSDDLMLRTVGITEVSVGDLAAVDAGRGRRRCRRRRPAHRPVRDPAAEPRGLTRAVRQSSSAASTVLRTVRPPERDVPSLPIWPRTCARDPRARRGPGEGALRGHRSTRACAARRSLRAAEAAPARRADRRRRAGPRAAERRVARRPPGVGRAAGAVAAPTPSCGWPTTRPTCRASAAELAAGQPGPRGARPAQEPPARGRTASQPSASRPPSSTRWRCRCTPRSWPPHEHRADRRSASPRSSSRSPPSPGSPPRRPSTDFAVAARRRAGARARPTPPRRHAAATTATPTTLGGGTPTQYDAQITAAANQVRDRPGVVEGVDPPGVQLQRRARSPAPARRA